MADYMHFSLRLNRDLPEHRRIIKFLDEMDTSKYKSKTSFLVDAIAFYIDCIEDGSLEKLKDVRFRQFSNEYVTKDEFEERMRNLSSDIENKIYREILSAYIGKTVVAPHEEQVKEESMEEDLSQYAEVMDNVMSWSGDDS